MIKDDESYVLIPRFEEGMELKTRGMFGKDLKASVNESILNNALDSGKPFVYKGNEYFLDIAL